MHYDDHIKMNYDDHIQLAEEEIDALTPTFEPVDSPLSFALPALRFTDRQMQIMLNLSEAPLYLALFLIGNRCIKTGKIHEYRVRELAKKLGFKRETLYRAVNVLNALGFAKLRLKHLKLSGRLLDSPEKRMKADDTVEAAYPLKIASLHRDYLKPLLDTRPTRSMIKLFLLAAFYCDETTGTLNTHLRGSEWAEKIGCDRTTAEKAFDRLAADGFLHTERDYVISGRHPGAAMGFWQIHLTAALKKQENAENKKRRKQDSQPYQNIEHFLLKCFGIDARGAAQVYINEAKAAVKKLIEVDGLAALSRFKACYQGA